MGKTHEEKAEQNKDKSQWDQNLPNSCQPWQGCGCRALSIQPGFRPSHVDSKRPFLLKSFMVQDVTLSRMDAMGYL